MAESSDMEQLLTAFRKFSVYGDPKSTGKELNGKTWAKLCKDCKIIDGKNVSSTDVDIVFSKVKQRTARVITYEEFQRALEELAPKRFKGQSKEEALQSIHKLVEGREPTNVGVTKVAKAPTVDRLTDTSRYTGSHKERFDESGRGKGREGREEIVETTGYVNAYKNSGTYDTKVKTEKGTPLLEAQRKCSSPASALRLDQSLNCDHVCASVYELYSDQILCKHINKEQRPPMAGAVIT